MNAALMVMDADGSNQTMVLANAGTLRGGVDWSPDGTQLVFTSNLKGEGVYVIDVDGTDLTKVISLNTTLLTRPVWSPESAPGLGDDAYRIAYCGQPAAGERTDLYLVCPDGPDPVRLTDTADHGENYPTWFPDGTKLAVTAAAYQQNDLWGLYDFSAETYEVQQHEGFLEGAGANAPSWAKTQPDTIAWRFWTADRSDLCVVDLDDPSQPALLTDTPTVEEGYPSWSPDDTQVVYQHGLYRKSRFKGWAISVMDADGTGSQVIQTGGVGPAWRRNAD